MLLRRAEEITDLVAHTRQEIAHADDCVDGCITMGCGILSSGHLLADLIRQYHQRFPLVTFDLYTGTADEVTERMQDGLIDIGLLLEPTDLEQFDYVRLPLQRRGRYSCAVMIRWQKGNVSVRKIYCLHQLFYRDA